MKGKLITLGLLSLAAILSGLILSNIIVNASSDGTQNDVSTQPAPGAPQVSCQWLGVNFTGAENFVPANLNQGYIYGGIDSCSSSGDCEYHGPGGPSHGKVDEFAYYASKGIRLVRFAVRWERMQPTLFGPIDPAQITLFNQVLANANANGMRVILDSHEAARRSVSNPPVTGQNEQYIGQTSQLPYTAFQDYWQKMAAAFTGKAGLWAYELNSEPHDMGNNWNVAAQYGINGVRASDPSTTIIICLNEWCGGSSVNGNNNGPLLALNDPANNLVYSAHQYFDVSDGEGGGYQSGYTSQNSPQTGVQVITPFVQWCESHGVRCMVGEYGIPDNDSRWLPVLDNFLTYLSQHPVIVGATAWWASPWPGDPLWIEPTGSYPNINDRPQMAVLSSHAGTCSGGTPPPAPTNTPIRPTSTPPRPTNTPNGPTNTPSGPTNTPRPTNTPGGPANTPTNTYTPAPPASASQVYAEGLVNGWQDDSWDSTVNLADPLQHHSGSVSVSCAYNVTYGGLFFSHSGFNTTGYSNLVFYINGGLLGGQPISVKVIVNGSIPVDLNLNSYLAGGRVPTNAWGQATIPLTDLLGNDTTITGIMVQDDNGIMGSIFYIDDMQFTGSQGAPTNTRTSVPRTATRTFTPKPGATATPTNPPAPATSTPVSSTRTAVAATNTPALGTNTPVPPSNTAVPATATGTGSTPTQTATANSTPAASATPGTGQCVAVTWKDLANVSVTGNSIRKTTGTYTWDAGAASNQTLLSGNGYAQVTADVTYFNTMFGLSNGDSNPSSGDIDFGVVLDGAGAVKVYERGTLRGAFGTYRTGDIMRVAVELDQTTNKRVVRYYKNGTAFYTNTNPTINYPLLLDTSIYHVSGRIQQGQMCGPAEFGQ